MKTGADGLAPAAKCFRRMVNARIERPRARVVCLVLVQPNHAVLDVDVSPRQRRRLPFPHPFGAFEN